MSSRRRRRTWPWRLPFRLGGSELDCAAKNISSHACHLQEFLEEVRYFEAKLIVASSPEEDVVPVTASVEEEGGQLCRARKSSCVVLRRSPVPTPTPTPTLTPVPMLTPTLTPTPAPTPTPTPTPTPGLVMTVPPSIPSVRYRWQRGFRKAHNGRYVKVILRIWHILPWKSWHILLDYSRKTTISNVTNVECFRREVWHFSLDSEFGNTEKTPHKSAMFC